ncbi:MAG: twin-arginine translocation signal domain-containing protein [Bacillota bacterium]
MLSIPSSPTPRRGFLGRVAMAAAAVGLGSSVPASLAGEASTPQSAGADPQLDAWFAKIRGKHRQVFDSPEAAGGVVAIWPRVYLMTMDATYPNQQGTAVVILRHAAIPLAMQDSLWAKYKFGEVFNIKAGDAPATANPYAVITGLPIPGLGISELLKSGVLVGVCNAALTVYSGAVAKQTNGDAAAIKQEWIAGLFPGVQVVPSGVMAVGRAQELGCTYCFAG